MKKAMRSVWLVAALLACSRSENTPQEVLRPYLDAIAAGDVERAARYVTREDADAAGERNLRPSEAGARLFAPDARLEIVTLVVTDDTATASVSISMPRLDSNESVQLLQAVGANDAAERDRIVDAARKRPFSTSVETYELVREDGQWRVAPGWATEKARRDEAVTRVKKSEADAVRYAQQIAVQLRVVDKQSYDNQPYKAIEGTIVNTTRATITMLDIVIEYRDRDGKVIFEEKNHPVLTQRVTDEALREYARKTGPPIGPGESRRISYVVPDDVPESWNGDVSGHATEVEFDGEP